MLSNQRHQQQRILAAAYSLDKLIHPVIDKADAFLKAQIVDGVTGISYIGPSGTDIFTTAQRNLAISLKDAFDKSNDNLGRPQCITGSGNNSFIANGRRTMIHRLIFVNTFVILS